MEKQTLSREALKGFGLESDTIDKIMQLNGNAIEGLKSELTEAKATIDNLNNSLSEAKTTIAGFKDVNIDELKSQIASYEAKSKENEAKYAGEIAKIRLSGAVETALLKSKAKNSKAVMSLLDNSIIKLDDSGNVVGLSEQITKLKETDGYLFENNGTSAKDVGVGVGGSNSTLSGVEREFYARNSKLQKE